MMNIKNLTLGIEEEYQIIDPETRELTSFISEFLEKGAMIFKDALINRMCDNICPLDNVLHSDHF